MKRRIAVRTVIVHNGKILCIKQKQTGDVIKGDYWCTVGGGLEATESLLSGLRRETVEETGVEPVIGNLLFVQQFLGNGKEHLEFFFHVSNTEDFMNIDLTNTSHGMKEIAEIKFVDPKVANIMPAFLKDIDLSGIGNNPTKVFTDL